MCVFEYIYFSRPDSVIEGQSVHEARKQAGRFLAQEHPVQADVVIGVPDSGLDAALGYSAGERHPLRHRLHQKQIHWPHLHPGQPEAAREQRPHQAQRR